MFDDLDEELGRLFSLGPLSVSFLPFSGIEEGPVGVGVGLKGQSIKYRRYILRGYINI